MDTKAKKPELLPGFTTSTTKNNSAESIDIIVTYVKGIGIVDNISKVLIFPFSDDNISEKSKETIQELIFNISSAGLKFMIIDDTIIAAPNFIDNEKFNHAETYESYAELVSKNSDIIDSSRM